MSKSLTLSCITSSLILCILLLPASGKTLIVDGHAKGAAPDGSAARPYPTIQRAAEAAGAGDTVLVHAGVYRETVTPKNSGQPGAPITYKPFPGETVTVSGTEIIGGWKPGPGNLFQAPMLGHYYPSRYNYSDQIFSDGQMLTLAQWPHTSSDLSAPVKSTLTKFLSKTRDKATNWTTAVFEDAHLTPATDDYYVGAEIFLQPNDTAWSWAFTGLVTAQKGTQLTIRTRADTGKDGQQDMYAVGSRYYLFNTKKMLDAPGEWFHDTASGVLFLKMAPGDAPARHVIEARARDLAFDLNDRSDITIQGFHLFACTINTDAEAGSGIEWDKDGNDLYPWRNGGTLPASHDILLDGLDAKYVSHYTDRSGHFFLQRSGNSGINISGIHQTIQNCHIQYSAGNGITSYGRGNRIVNNLVEDTDYGATDAAGISTLGGLGAFDFEISNNTVRRTGRSGMILRGLQNSDASKLLTRVHHNDISQFMLQDFDGGAIYTFGQDAKFARVDHNWFHGATGPTVSGFYTDYSKNWIVDHNVIWDVEWPIHLEGAHSSGVVDALVYNNTVLGRNAAVGIGNGQAPGSVFVNNIFSHDLGKAQAGASLVKNNLQWDGLAGSATNPKFVDAAHGNFQLQAASPARRGGISLSSLSTIQPGNPDIIVTLPPDSVSRGACDQGAYAFGAAPWKAGSDLRAILKAPAAPSRLTAKAASSTQIALAWINNSSSASGFEIERSTNKKTFTPAATTGGSTTVYVDQGLSRSTTYTYRVRAISAAGSSSYTPSVTIKTLAQTLSDAQIRQTAKILTRESGEDSVWAADPANLIGRLNSDTKDPLIALSGVWKGFWDSHNLYLQVTVTDPILVSYDPKLAWYLTDGVEVYLDANNGKASAYDGIHDFQIGFDWGAENVQFGPNSHKVTDGFPFKMTATPKGYRLMAVFPWAMTLGYSPKPGALIGLDVHINDNDDGIHWKGKRSWFARGNLLWMHPNEFGTVELLPSGTATR